MPALVRGGRRQGSKPAPKAGSKPGSARSARMRAPVAAGKLQAMTGVAISDRVTGGVVLTLLCLLSLVVLFTGGRAGRLAAATGEAGQKLLAGAGLRLERVHIEGASPEAVGEIRSRLQLYRGEPITAIDLGAVRRSVEAVGWVSDVKIMRLLPDTLVVAVSERGRLAVWQHEGKAQVIDGQGVVIPEADPARFSRLPLVVGEGAAEAAPAVLGELRQRPRLMSRLEALVRVDGRRWDLRLTDGSLIQLPASGEASALIELDRLDHEQRLLELGFERVDLRVPDAIAVLPRRTAGLAGSKVSSG